MCGAPSSSSALSPTTPPSAAPLSVLLLLLHGQPSAHPGVPRPPRPRVSVACPSLALACLHCYSAHPSGLPPCRRRAAAPPRAALLPRVHPVPPDGTSKLCCRRKLWEAKQCRMMWWIRCHTVAFSHLALPLITGFWKMSSKLDCMMERGNIFIHFCKYYGISQVISPCVLDA